MRNVIVINILMLVSLKKSKIIPKQFEKCVDEGGKVRTKSLKGDKYIHICYKDGKSYAGEVKKKKKTTSTSNGELRE